LQIKQIEPQYVETSSDDITQQIIDYAKLEINQIDIEPIIEAQSNFDWVDISFLTQRPAPFQREKEIDNLAIKSKKALEARKVYMAHFPKLNRTERNSKSHPFENSSSVGYGQGVRLYRNND
jgi:hypothetical protein